MEIIKIGLFGNNQNVQNDDSNERNKNDLNA